MNVNKMVDACLDAPAPDEEVAMVYAVYKDSVACGEPRDLDFEAQCKDHLAGTEFEEML